MKKIGEYPSGLRNKLFDINILVGHIYRNINIRIPQLGSSNLPSLILYSDYTGLIHGGCCQVWSKVTDCESVIREFEFHHPPQIYTRR